MDGLELECSDQGREVQDRPPWGAKCGTVQAEIDSLKSKLAGIEKKTSSISADFDGDDVDRQMKRMKKRVDELFEIVEKS